MNVVISINLQGEEETKKKQKHFVPAWQHWITKLKSRKGRSKLISII